MRACGSRCWCSSARVARCRPQDIPRWCGRRSSRPRLRGDRGRVAADRIVQRIQLADAQKIDEVALDRADQPDAAIYEAAVELHEIRAGLDLGEGGRARVDPARTDE